VFEDREQAGQLLAKKLLPYKNSGEALVVGVPRGGIPVAVCLAHDLHLPLDFIIARKLGAPGNKELAVGAVGPEGIAVYDQDLIERLAVPKDYLETKKKEIEKEIQKRTKRFRKGGKEKDIRGKVAILVDDGIATGATLEAAVKYLRKKKAKKIVLAVPVAPQDTLEKFKKIVEEIVVVKTPQDFYAVGQFYLHFPQVDDQSVVKLLRRF